MTNLLNHNYLNEKRLWGGEQQTLAHIRTNPSVNRAANGHENAKAQDTTPLTVTLASAAQIANDATAFNVAITFSEAVTGFVLADIVFNNATAAGVLRMTNASTYEVSALADNSGDVAITVPAGAVMAGTKTNMASNTLRLPYDHAPPVVLAAAATSMTSPFTVTATFSEAVTGFAVDDITISRKLLRPVSCAKESVTNCDHRDTLRKERPQWCCLASISNSCLDMGFTNWENAVLSRPTAWVPFCFSMIYRDFIVTKQGGFRACLLAP